MAIVVGDIHGDVEKVKTFLAYRPDQEHIALGDIVDSELNPPSRQIECLNLLFEAGTTLLWGNHDIQYAGMRACPCSGSITNSPVPTIVMDNKDRFKAAHAVDGYILTHAGICTQISNGCTDPVELADELNRRVLIPHEFKVNRPLDPIFNISYLRGGRDDFSGIFWFDSLHEAGIDRDLRQVFGHCEIKTRPEMDKFGHLNLNWWGRDICYLFDTERDEIVEIPITPMDKGQLKRQYNREVSRKISGSYYNIYWGKGHHQNKEKASMGTHANLIGGSLEGHSQGISTLEQIVASDGVNANINEMSREQYLMNAVANAVAQQTIEGLEVSPDVIEEMKRAARGEITIEEGIRNTMHRFKHDS
jgi:hypothetical protein